MSDTAYTALARRFTREQHGIQATLCGQQMAARQQLEDMRRRLPAGSEPDPQARPGTYL